MGLNDGAGFAFVMALAYVAGIVAVVSIASHHGSAVLELFSSAWRVALVVAPVIPLLRWARGSD